MKIYIRNSNEFFPVYEKEVLLVGEDQYTEVIDETGNYDPVSQYLGKWVVNLNDNQEYTAYREILDLQQHEVDKKTETEWHNVRMERNTLLSQSDFTVLPDCQLSDALKSEYLLYRQALRDITDPLKNGGVSNPFDIVFPQEPTSP